jgi:hypothetical protein
VCVCVCARPHASVVVRSHLCDRRLVVKRVRRASKKIRVDGEFPRRSNGHVAAVQQAGVIAHVAHDGRARCRCFGKGVPQTFFVKLSLCSVFWGSVRDVNLCSVARFTCFTPVSTRARSLFVCLFVCLFVVRDQKNLCSVARFTPVSTRARSAAAMRRGQQAMNSVEHTKQCVHNLRRNWNSVCSIK